MCQWQRFKEPPLVSPKFAYWKDFCCTSIWLLMTNQLRDSQRHMLSVNCKTSVILLSFCFNFSNNIKQTHLLTHCSFAHCFHSVMEATGKGNVASCGRRGGHFERACVCVLFLYEHVYTAGPSVFCTTVVSGAIGSF